MNFDLSAFVVSIIAVAFALGALICNIYANKLTREQIDNNKLDGHERLKQDIIRRIKDDAWNGGSKVSQQPIKDEWEINNKTNGALNMDDLEEIWFSAYRRAKNKNPDKTAEQIIKGK